MENFLVGYTQSIVQGSGIGPFLYIIFVSDLKLLPQRNQLCKYADDTTLIIPQNTNVSVNDEFRLITLCNDLLKTN